MYRETVKVTEPTFYKMIKHAKDFLKKSNTMNYSMDIKSQFYEDVTELLFIYCAFMYLFIFNSLWT